MPNRSETDFSEKVPSGKIKGKTKAKHKMIAELIARGFSVKEVAKTMKLSESQISHLLSDEDSFVNHEISRITSNFFAENDRLLVNLYNKALQKLDELLSSPKQKIQLQAIDRVFKILVARSAQKEEERRPETIDDWILRRAKERRYTPRPNRKDSSHPNPKGSSDSPPHDSAPGNSSTDNSAPDGSSPDTSSSDFKKFLESIT